VAQYPSSLQLDYPLAIIAHRLIGDSWPVRASRVSSASASFSQYGKRNQLTETTQHGNPDTGFTIE